MRAAVIDVQTLKFDEKGLIPAIVQDAETGRVLTLAYMNRQSLAISLEKGPGPGRSCGVRGKPAAITSTLWSCGPTVTGTPS